MEVTDWEGLLRRHHERVEQRVILFYPSTIRTVAFGPINFEVRLCPTIGMRLEADVARGPDFNPFLPYDPRVHVRHLCEAEEDPRDRHALLMNKFCLVPGHLLVITKEYEAQSERLRRSSLAACIEAMRVFQSPGLDWLVFFNCGPKSGASQHHKHLQLLPIRQGERIPLETALPEPADGSVQTIPAYRAFRHAAIVWPHGTGMDLDRLQRAYETCLGKLGLPEAYNLLFTRRWLLMVPRRSGSCSDGLSFNSLSYAGYFMVKSGEELGRFSARPGGPLGVLAEVAFPLNE